MTKPEKKNSSLPADAKRERRRRASEACATVGLLLVCAGLVAPFVSFDNEVLLEVFKWVYMAGAVIFTVARLFNVNDPGDGVRVKRIRRMEGWPVSASVSVPVSGFITHSALAGSVSRLP